MRHLSVVLLCAAAILVTLVVVMEFRAPDVNPFGTAINVIQAIVTILAIILGGSWAYFKLQVFRDFEPYLTIDQEVSHRRISGQYVHIAVTITLHNSSKVKVEVREAFFRLQHVAPLPDEDIERLYAQVFVDHEEDSIQWPTYDEAPRAWGKGELIIEPGESHRETYEFIVSREIQSIIVYAYFHNSEYREHSYNAQGWSATTVHDIL